MTKSGRFYGVGVGPGDPELLTLKALRILQEVSTIFYPERERGRPSYAAQIVQYIVKDQEKLKGLRFLMVKEQEPLREFWEQSVSAILAELKRGHNVAFITEGDPFFYSTFVSLYELLREKHPEIAIEVIPGVSSVMAASAAAQVPLAIRDDRVAIIPATYENTDLKIVLHDFDTIVLLKVNSVFEKIVSLLREMNLLHCATFIERCGTSEERITNNLEMLIGEKLHYFSLIIIRKG